MTDEIFTNAFKQEMKPIGYPKPVKREKPHHGRPTLKKRPSRRKSKLPKKVKIKALETKLKAVLYPLIKKRDGPTCISCGKIGLVGRNWQAGHYAKAELCNLVYRYDPRNINSQCMTCNKWRRGNTLAYRQAMIRKYGKMVVEEIDTCYGRTLNMNFNPRTYLEELIKKYKNA